MLNIDWTKEIAEAKDEVTEAKKVIQTKTDRREMPNRFDCFNLTVAYDNLSMILEMQKIQLQHNNNLQKSMDLIFFRKKLK